MAFLSGIVQLIDHWQTLIAGLLALAAGVGTVRATVKSADREVAAAREQTKAAQRQTAVVREIERRRIAREGYAFHAMLEAAMGVVIEDAEAASAVVAAPGPLHAGNYSVQAYEVRQRVKRTGFTELRSAFVRFGGSLTPQFLQLDNEISVFAQQVMTTYNSATGAPTLLGANAGLSEHLTISSSERSRFATKPRAE
jgi:hypothetical protein